MTLDTSEKRLARFFTACVLGNWTVVEGELTSGPVDSSWREALLQVHVFAGFPRLVQAFRIVNEIRPLPCAGAPEAPASQRSEAGQALFETIYGDLAPSVRRELSACDPAFAAWIAEHAYARVLARPGLSPRLRELLAIGALAALAQDRQLASHTRGALRCGAGPEEPGQVLAALTDLAAAETLAAAHGVVARFAQA
jgi:4-carboxymuconolactone decarboxylase